MTKGESIKDMYTRFGKIVNPMKNLGIKLKEEQLVRNVLRSLTSDWSSKTTAIQEAKDLSILSLDDLIGSLMAYEVQLENMKIEEKSISKKKELAFKAIKEESDLDDSNSDEEEELALLTRRFRRFIQKQGKKVNKFSNDIICFECKKKGHIRKDCPMIKKKKEEKDRELDRKKKKTSRKAYKAT